VPQDLHDRIIPRVATVTRPCRHANTRGKWVVGRILLRYFEPRKSNGR